MDFLSTNKKNLIILILIAYLFSLLFRYIYIYQIGNNPEFLWNGTYIINTNDGYYFGSGVQKVLYGMHQYNPLTPNLFDRGLVFLTTILVKILPFSLDSIMFYLSAFISSLIVIPIILLGNLYKEPLWGFFSALIASIAWSYYNRTMLGYYDTDMFSIMILMWIVYFLMKSVKDNNLNTVYIASLVIIIYPFLYQSGKIVTYSLIIFYALYILWQNRFNENSLKIVSLVFLAATPIPFERPYNFIISFILVTLLYFIYKKIDLNKKITIAITLFTFIILFFYGDIFEAILSKILNYTHKSSEVNNNGLKFFGVYQTIAEASGIPFFANGENNSVANRIIGSSLGFIVAIVGYLFLVYRKKEFIILLPLVGIGIFSHWGGLRFTIYAVPILALSFVYLIYEFSYSFSKSRKIQFMILSTISILALIPNIIHGYNYNKYTTPVFTNSQIKQINHLKNIANPKDYTLSWWDYGYPIWFYTNTNTLIDGGKHHHDNFIISKILLSNSSILAANLARLSVEEYAKFYNSFKKWKSNGAKKSEIPLIYKFKDNKGNIYNASSIDKPVIDFILKDKQKNQVDPYEFFRALEKDDFKLPQKTRDIYLYMPTTIKSIRIFPVIAQFSNLDLTTGKRLRDVVFYLGYLRGVKNNKLFFSNGLIINSRNGQSNINNQKINKILISEFRQDGSINLNIQTFDKNSNINLLYLKSLGTGILMDNKTLNSNYVKMFLLGIYDKNLFELVDAAPYGRIYKLKK